ncbi:polysialyltransferase family glycosyltransferase [Luteirhabdus pelagi]|jgi:hypothetical protein|uniref:polysialyltransferase family glycosyltransferase n=1 Tax=Luteirhabdus pelagi TaxID=2792783 RepID=UPI0019395D3D|nr:hypothetical protein [Luteirhabdus pelagi]
MNHIFVALGQHHVNNFETLLRHELIEQGTYVLMAGADVSYDETMWDRIVNASCSFNNTAKSKLNQVEAIKNKIRIYKGMIGEISDLKSEPVTVYTSYIEDVLSNFLFFSFGTERKAIVVEDGTLNYYDHSLQNISSIKFFLKQAIARLYGINFKRYIGHSSGAGYDHVKKQYITFPEFAFIDRNAEQLPVEKISVAHFSDTLYIIGQESYGNLLGQAFFERALKTYLETLRKQEFYPELNTIYYKPHRNGKQLPKSFFTSVLTDKVFEIVRTPMTSETLYFETLRSKYVAAFDSSTLINIRARLYEKNLSQVQFIVNPLKNDELIPLFKKLNFSFMSENVN